LLTVPYRSGCPPFATDAIPSEATRILDPSDVVIWIIPSVYEIEPYLIKHALLNTPDVFAISHERKRYSTETLAGWQVLSH